MAHAWRQKQLTVVSWLLLLSLLLASATFVQGRERPDLVQCPVKTYCPQTNGTENDTNAQIVQRGRRRRRLRQSPLTRFDRSSTATLEIVICIVSDKDDDNQTLTTTCVDENDPPKEMVQSFYSCGCCPGDTQEWCDGPFTNTTTSEPPSTAPSLTPSTAPSLSTQPSSAPSLSTQPSIAPSPPPPCAFLDDFVYEWRSNTTFDYLNLISQQPDYSPGDTLVFDNHLLTKSSSTSTTTTTMDAIGTSMGRCVVLQDAETPYNEYCNVFFTFPEAGTLYVAGILGRQQLVALHGTGCFVNTTAVVVTQVEEESSLATQSTTANETWTNYLAFQFKSSAVSTEAIAANVTDYYNNTTNSTFQMDEEEECMEMRSPPSASSSADTEEDTVVEWFHTLGDQAIDWNSNGASVGDLFVFDRDIVHTRQEGGGGINGILEGECMFLQTVNVNHLYCTMTFLMGNNNDDLLVVEGPFQEMAILGGTGCFQDASGVVSGSYPSSPIAQYNIAFDDEYAWDTNTSCPEGIFDTVWILPTATYTLVDYGQDGRADPGDAYVFDNMPVTIPWGNQTALQGTMAGRCFVVAEEKEYCTYIMNIPGGLIAFRGIQQDTLTAIAGSGCYQSLAGTVGADLEGDQIRFSFLNQSHF